MTQKHLTVMRGSLKITTQSKLLKLSLVLFIFLVVVAFCSGSYALANEDLVCTGSPGKFETNLRKKLGKKLLAYEGCPAEMGAWYMLPMPQEEDRMQAVHAALLPNSKVLIANGSSNRNHVTVNGKLEDGLDNSKDEVVDNTSIFDPSLSDFSENNPDPDFTTSPFERISSPPAKFNGEINDLFCSGHLQLPNGDVLFVGGTRTYYPGVKFGGSRNTNIFHWGEEYKDDPWENVGFTEDGHWYPTLIPLADGEIASFSGLTISPSQEISTLVEIYDPAKKTWQSIDVKNLPNSPFVTRMNDENFSSDTIDLYTRILPTQKKNRFLITGDGGGKNNAKIAHASVHSYFITFNKDAVTEEYSVSFEKGPDRKAINKVYGTAVLDPSSPNGDVLLMGGILGTNNIGIGPGKDVIEGATIAASLERWKAPSIGQLGAKGSWEIDQNFFAKIDEDILIETEDIVDGKVKRLPLNYKYVQQSSNLGRYGKRAMEQAVILPSKEILVVNGGNYAETRPAFNPTLLIPDTTKLDHQGFRTKLMNPDVEPRLYHNNALLLPDARVLVMGGNNSRAARYDADGSVRLDTKNDFAFVEKGTEGNSGEIWQHAIFYPPYLFGESPRPEIETDITKLQYGAAQTISVSNASSDQRGSVVLAKLGSATHSFDMGQRLIELDSQVQPIINGTETSISFNAPTNDHFSPPGYYMLFYVNSDGHPSHAKIVQLANA